MSYSPKPCVHCGGIDFQVLPGVQLDVRQASTVFGMVGSRAATGSGRWWTFTVVLCARCGHADAFSTNTAGVARHISGAYVATSATG